MRPINSLFAGAHPVITGTSLPTQDIGFHGSFVGGKQTSACSPIRPAANWPSRGQRGPSRWTASRRYFASNADGSYPFVGTPDKVAEELAVISRAGMRGIGLSFIDYLNEVPYFCDEVLPRPERAGGRAGG
jgi:alkanesulfonate monooxygenase SsuD/methylene tetrahydromethanopterin reductase-like flavin-dependent oxidoreductase (luciferase family)